MSWYFQPTLAIGDPNSASLDVATITVTALDLTPALALTVTLDVAEIALVALDLTPATVVTLDVATLTLSALDVAAVLGYTATLDVAEITLVALDMTAVQGGAGGDPGPPSLSSRAGVVVAIPRGRILRPA
jgi:hypothetical protein